jgi:hypothetical protein
MASTLLDYIGEFIKNNNAFLDSFRVNGVQLPNGEVVEFTDGTEKRFIGISDNFGTAGYIRYNPQINYQQNSRRISSARSGAYIKNCRLVAFSWNPEIGSETLMGKMVNDLKSIPFTTAKRKPTVTIRRSNHNYIDIFTEESLKEMKDSGGSQFTCISIDFDLTYYEGECEICEPNDPDLKYVLIIDQDGNVIARKVPPQNYNVTVFDTINGGSPDTVYELTITPSLI